MILGWIDEATRGGARLDRACEVPGVDLLLGESAIVDDGGVIEDDLGPLLVAEAHVRSQTLRHLHGRILASQPGTVCLTGVVHQPDPAGRAANLLPPAVEWAAQVGGGLLLQGCHVSGTVASSPATRVMLVATATQGIPSTRSGVVSIVG